MLSACNPTGLDVTYDVELTVTALDCLDTIARATHQRCIIHTPRFSDTVATGDQGYMLAKDIRSRRGQ